MVLTESTVLHVPLAEAEGHTVCSIVVTEAGIVVTLSEVEVERLLVVIVANWVALADVWHCDMMGGECREQAEGGRNP